MYLKTKNPPHTTRTIVFLETNQMLKDTFDFSFNKYL